MPLTVTKYPPIVAPAKNPMVVKLTTPVTEADGTSAITQLLYTTGETAEETYRFQWDNDAHDITITAKVSPLTNGLEIPTRVGEQPLEEYLIDVATYLGYNAELVADFDIGSGADFVELVAKLIGSAYTQTVTVSAGAEAVPSVTAGVDNTVKANIRIALQVWRYLSGAPVMLFEDILTALIVGTDAEAVFDIAEILQTHLNSEVKHTAALPSAALARPNICKPFLLKYYEQYIDINEALVETTAQISVWRYSLNGMIPPCRQQEFYQSQESLWDYITSNNLPYLTWLVLGKVTDINAPERMYLITPANIPEVMIYLFVNYNDGEEQEAQIAIERTWYPYEVVEIDLNIKQLLPEADWDVITGYSVHLSNEAETWTTGTLSFTIDNKSYPNLRYFLFQNSLGGFECARFTGEAAFELSYQRDIYDQAYLSEVPGMPVKSQLTPQRQETAKLNTGWISLVQLMWFEDFLASNQVFEIKNGKRFPVVVTQDKLETHRDNSFLYSLTIAVEYLDAPFIYQPDLTDVWEEVENVVPPNNE